MGTFHSVRGWLQVDEVQLEHIKQIIAADVDEVGHYTASWYFPTAGGGYSTFVFFGCTVRDSALLNLKRQIARIASEAVSEDPPYTDYPTGVFHISPEDGPESIWRVSDSRLLEKS
jgi:hypothetical protein